MNPFLEAERPASGKRCSSHRSRPGQDHRGVGAGLRPAARQGRDRAADRQGAQPANIPPSRACAAALPVDPDNAVTNAERLLIKRELLRVVVFARRRDAACGAADENLPAGPADLPVIPRTLIGDRSYVIVIHGNSSSLTANADHNNSRNERGTPHLTFTAKRILWINHAPSLRRDFPGWRHERNE
jgi:hypothetical protein